MSETSLSLSRCHRGQDDFLNGEQSSFERPRRKFRPRLHLALILHRLRIHTIRSWFIFVPTVKPFEESYTKERGRRNVTPLMLRRIRACRAYKKKKGVRGTCNTGSSQRAVARLIGLRVSLVDDRSRRGLRTTRLYRLQRRTNTLSSPISLPPAALQQYYRSPRWT